MGTLIQNIDPEPERVTGTLNTSSGDSKPVRVYFQPYQTYHLLPIYFFPISIFSLRLRFCSNISGRCICGWGREEEEVAKGGMVRLTADLIWNSPHFFNANWISEIPVIENLGATEFVLLIFGSSEQI
ncbi:hypothetical protein LINPERHAP2_LOCUS15353 [Linum perenne]